MSIAGESQTSSGKAAHESKCAMSCPDTAALPSYTIILDWDPAARRFVATVPALPGCVGHGRTRAQALQQGAAAMRTWLGAARSSGTPIPAPTGPQFATGLAEAEAEGPF